MSDKKTISNRINLKAKSNNVANKFPKKNINSENNKKFLIEEEGQKNDKKCKKSMKMFKSLLQIKKLQDELENIKPKQKDLESLVLKKQNKIDELCERINFQSNKLIKTKRNYEKELKKKINEIKKLKVYKFKALDQELYINCLIEEKNKTNNLVLNLKKEVEEKEIIIVDKDDLIERLETNLEKMDSKENIKQEKGILNKEKRDNKKSINFLLQNKSLLKPIRTFGANIENLENN